MVLLHPHCRCLCNTLQNAEARNCAMPPRSLCPNEPNNGCGCSLMRRDIVEQFPGDICGESLGMPPHTPSSPHTSPLHPPSLATAVVRALRREIKKRLLLSPCRRDGRLFPSLFFFFCLTRFTPTEGEVKGEERKKKTTVWRKERKLYCVLWRSTTPPITPHPTPSPPPPAPSTAPPVERERAREERREGGQGHVIRRACGHSFTPRQNERGPAVSLLHD